MAVKQSDILRSVSNIVSFIKEQTRNNLITANRNGTVNIDEATLQRIANIVETSITQAYVKSSREIESVTKNLKWVKVLNIW